MSGDNDIQKVTAAPQFKREPDNYGVVNEQGTKSVEISASNVPNHMIIDIARPAEKFVGTIMGIFAANVCAQELAEPQKTEVVPDDQKSILLELENFSISKDGVGPYLVEKNDEVKDATTSREAIVGKRLSVKTIYGDKNNITKFEKYLNDPDPKKYELIKDIFKILGQLKPKEDKATDISKFLLKFQSNCKTREIEAMLFEAKPPAPSLIKPDEILGRQTVRAIVLVYELGQLEVEFGIVNDFDEYVAMFNSPDKTEYLSKLVEFKTLSEKYPSIRTDIGLDQVILAGQNIKGNTAEYIIGLYKLCKDGKIGTPDLENILHPKKIMIRSEIVPADTAKKNFPGVKEAKMIFHSSRDEKAVRAYEIPKEGLNGSWKAGGSFDLVFQAKLDTKVSIINKETAGKLLDLCAQRMSEIEKVLNLQDEQGEKKLLELVDEAKRQSWIATFNQIRKETDTSEADKLYQIDKAVVDEYYACLKTMATEKLKEAKEFYNKITVNPPEKISKEYKKNVNDQTFANIDSEILAVKYKQAYIDAKKALEYSYNEAQAIAGSNESAPVVREVEKTPPVLKVKAPKTEEEPYNAVDAFNRWMFGNEISNAFQDLNNDHLLRFCQRYVKGDLDRDGIKEEGESWEYERDKDYQIIKDKKRQEKYKHAIDLLNKPPLYSGYLLAPIYYPSVVCTSIASKLVPTFVNKLEYQPFGTEVMNTRNLGMDNSLNNVHSFGIEFGTDLSKIMRSFGILPQGYLGNLTFQANSSEFEDGGNKIGSDTKLGAEWQSLDPDRGILNGAFPSLLTEPLFKGKLNTWPGEVIRLFWRMPSYLNYKARNAKGFWKVPGIVASVPLTALQFALEDLPNSILGANIRFSPVDNSERTDPSFYNPSVNAWSAGGDISWALASGLFITASYDHKSGEKYFSLDNPRSFTNDGFSARVEAPNVMGKEDWGFPYFTISPWLEYKRGREYIETSPGSSFTTETDPTTQEDATVKLPYHGGMKPVEYAKYGGGFTAVIGKRAKALVINAELSEEKISMQRVCNSTKVSLNYRQIPLTLSYQHTTNPIMYYDSNTRPEETQDKLELEFNPKQYWGTIKEFLPDICVGNETTNTVNGEKDNYTYFKVKYMFGREMDRKLNRVVAEDPYIKNLAAAKKVVRNNLHSLSIYFGDADSRKLIRSFNDALKKARTIITDATEQGKFAEENSIKFQRDINVFQGLVIKEGRDSGKVITMKAELEKFIDGLAGAANGIMAVLDLKDSFNNALSEAGTIITDEKEKATFADENSKDFQGNIEEFQKDVKNLGLDSRETITKKNEIEGSIKGLMKKANAVMAGIISQDLQNRFDATIKDVSPIITDEASQQKFISQRSGEFKDILLAYKAAAAPKGINALDALARKQDAEDFINALKDKAEKLQAILNAAASAELRAALISSYLSKFSEEYNKKMEEALLIIIPEGKKKDFKTVKDDKFETALKELKQYAESNLQAKNTQDKIDEIRQFITALKKDANAVMVGVIAGELTDKFTTAIKAACGLINDTAKKDRFENGSKNKFEKLISEYKEIAASDIASKPAVEKKASIENFIKGLNVTASTFAELEKKANKLKSGYTLQMNSAIASAYNEIMGSISQPLKALTVDLSSVTVDAVKASGKDEFKKYDDEFDSLLKEFLEIAENEGISSEKAQAAGDSVSDYITALPDKVRSVVNSGIKERVKGKLETTCKDIFDKAVSEAEKVTAQTNAETQKQTAITVFKKKNQNRYPAKINAYIKLAESDLCSSGSQAALRSLTACMKAIEEGGNRILLKLSAKTYLELLSYLYVDMAMERIALKSDGVIPSDKLDDFKKPSEEKYAAYTGVNFKDDELRKQLVKMSESKGDLQNIIDTLLKKQKRMEFDLSTGEKIYSADEIKDNQLVRDIWNKTELMIGDLGSDAKKTYGGQ